MNPPQSREEAADDLRRQAASCRRLAKEARTTAGTSALNKLGEHFDTDARRMDARSERR